VWDFELFLFLSDKIALGRFLVGYTWRNRERTGGKGTNEGFLGSNLYLFFRGFVRDNGVWDPSKRRGAQASYSVSHAYRGFTRTEGDLAMCVFGISVLSLLSLALKKAHECTRLFRLS
jgi:hypothetical protein